MTLESGFDQSKLEQTARNSVEGQLLLNQYRWESWSAAIDMSPDELVRLFDNDLQNYEHMPMMALLAQCIGHFEGVEQADIATAALLLHDLPEAKIHDGHLGGIALSLKTFEHEKEEARIFADIVARPEFAELLPCTPETIAGVMDESDSLKRSKGTNFTELSPAGQIVGLAEIIGYLRTARIAFKHYKDPAHADYAEVLLGWAVEPLTNHVPALLNIAPHSNAVQTFLEDSNPYIHEAMDEALENINALYTVLLDNFNDTVADKTVGSLFRLAERR